MEHVLSFSFVVASHLLLFLTVVVDVVNVCCQQKLRVFQRIFTSEVSTISIFRFLRATSPLIDEYLNLCSIHGGKVQQFFSTSV